MLDEERMREGRRLHALAKVCLDEGELDPVARELVFEIRTLAGRIFGLEDPEGVEEQLRERLAKLQREKHEVSF